MAHLTHSFVGASLLAKIREQARSYKGMCKVHGPFANGI